MIGLHPTRRVSQRVKIGVDRADLSVTGWPENSGSNGLSMEFARIMEKAGIESPVIRERQGKGRRVHGLSYHSFRHSAASTLFNAKIVEEVQKRVTGHARGQTLKTYTHVDLTAVKQATLMIPRLSSFSS